MAASCPSSFSCFLLPISRAVQGQGQQQQPGPRGAYYSQSFSPSAARSRRQQRGLDAAVLEFFPTMAYADVKAHKADKGTLECAVCLSELYDDETLRLLPKCSHVFHPDYIDTWLASHVTCLVCRDNLVQNANAPPVDDAPELQATPAQELPSTTSAPAATAAAVPAVVIFGRTSSAPSRPFQVDTGARTQVWWSASENASMDESVRRSAG